MSTAAWKVYGEQTLACMLESAEVKQWLRGDLVVGPGEAAIIIKDGKAEDVITEERRKLGGWTDRNLPTIKKWMGMGTDYRAMMVSTVPFAIPFTLNLITLDHQPILGRGVIRCCITADDAPSLASLLSGHQAVAIPDLLLRIKPELQARVFVPVVSRARHDELRGNVEMLKQLESSARTELQRLLGDWGIRLDSITVNWGLTEEECAVIAQKSKQLEDEAREFHHSRQLRDLERKQELIRLAQDMAQDDRKRALEGELDLRGIRFDASVSEEDKKSLLKLRVAEIDAEILQLDTDVKLAALAVDREKERIALDRQKEELALIKDKELFEREQDRIDFEMIQQNKRERMRLEQEHELTVLRQQQDVQRLQMDMQLQQMAVQLGMIERVMTQGMAAGAIDSITVQKMIEEQTKMRALDRGEGVAASVFKAEEAKHSMGAFKEAEDRERVHQQQMTHLSSEMMQAAKQPVSGGMTPMIGQTQPSVNVVNVQPAGQGTSGTSVETDDSCPECGKGIKKIWKACPFCGKAFGSSPKCVSCGKDVQVEWKACPACGVPVK